MPPSSTRSARSTSMVKSTCPGVLQQVSNSHDDKTETLDRYHCTASQQQQPEQNKANSYSMMLMCESFHLQKVAADWIVMPFSRSKSMESIFAPTPSFPRTSWIELIRPV